MNQRKQTISKIAQKSREEAAELLPLVEMGERGYLGCLAPRNFEAVDSFIFSDDFADDGAIPRIARIQSKYTRGSTKIPLNKLGFDFLVIVQDIFGKRKHELRAHRTVWVIPVEIVRQIWNGKAIVLSTIPNHCLVGDEEYANYSDPWQAISQFLSNPRK